MTAAGVCLVGGGAVGPALANPIESENRQRGLAFAERALLPPDTSRIDGYASVSVAAGARLELRVSTRPRARYRVQIARLGWYRGRGARLVACLPACSRDRRGTAQPRRSPDPVTGRLAAGWSLTDALRVPRGWTSGYYVARFVLTRGPRAGQSRSYPFIVREPPRRRAPILVLVPVNTWQAYNPWGGRSLYDFSSTPSRADKVSFERPYATLWDLIAYDYSLVRFLERGGYDVSYATDLDVHRNPALLAGRQLVITAGHGEYWTREMRDAFEAARARGTNLVFMGANTAHAQVRYEDGGRTVVKYASAAADPEPDPAAKTEVFSRLSPPRRPCELLGVEYFEGNLARTGDAPRAYTVVAAPSDPWLVGTGLRSGDVLDDLVGHEWDRVVPGCRVPDPTVLFHFERDGRSADAVRSAHGSGARVFSTGSLKFPWGLDAWGARAVGGARRQADVRLQRFMANVLRDLAPSA